MALQECGLNVNKLSRELQAHGTIEFPCAGYTSFHTEKEEDDIPWHWHEEMEIIYIREGRLNLKVPSKEMYLEQGDCAVINSNVLHYASAIEHCRLCSLVFSPRLITGEGNTVFVQKYMRPLISSKSFTGYVFPEGYLQEITGYFQSAFTALSEDAFGYEFTVRDNLSKVCLFLYHEFEEQMKGIVTERDKIAGG